MYYPSYDDYMRDIFYYNGLSNNGMGYMNGGAWNNMTYMPVNSMTYMNGNSDSNTNLNNLYPSIYRIVYPVVERVVSGSNSQFVNEETITNSTNTIYDIVKGDINYTQNINNSSTAQNTPVSTTANTATGAQAKNSNSINNSNNNLLKDLIRILVIRELIRKSNIRKFPCVQPMMPPYYINNMAIPNMV